MNNEEVYNEKISSEIKEIIISALNELLTRTNIKTVNCGKLNSSKTAKNIYHTNIELLKINEPKDLIEPLNELQKLPVMLFGNFSEKMIKNILYMRERRQIYFIIALHWFYKKRFNSKYRIPCRKGLAKLFEHYGEFFKILFDMCSEVYLIKKMCGEESLKPVERFEKILFEIRDNWVFTPIPHLNDVTTKQEDIKKWTKQLIQLRGLTNSIEKIRYPNIFNLIDESIGICKGKFSPNFKYTLWKDYLNIFDKSINILNSKDWCKVGMDDDGNIYNIVHRGNKQSKELIHIS